MLGPPSVPSSHHGQCCNSHNIHFCKQQPCPLPRQLRQSPAVAGWAQLTRKAKAGGSHSGQEAGAQSAVLLLSFPSDVISVRDWARLRIFHPAFRAAEVFGLQPFLHPSGCICGSSRNGWG